MSVVRYLVGVCVLLGGCGHVPTKPAVIAQPAAIMALPAIHVDRPVLAIHGLNENERQQPSEVVKAYVASIIQLQHYAKQLERVIDQLQRLHTQEY